MRKKKKNVFLKLLAVLFVIFMALFIANMSGYYESKIRDRVIITEEGIAKFEEKVSNGEEIDITSFLNTDREDYSSNMSNLGDTITEGFESFVVSGLDVAKNIINSLF